MTDEQINCAIADACGFTVELSHMQSGIDVIRDGKRKPLPDYCNSLNEMYDAEETLEGDLQNGFVYELRWITESKFWGDFKHCHASARQRAEAFLRTLDKWEGAK
ncbi:MAG: hypothetical protein ACO29P_05695 [Bacteroidia bacterium]